MGAVECRQGRESILDVGEALSDVIGGHGVVGHDLGVRKSLLTYFIISASRIPVSTIEAS
ncbi:hypothetical protein [Halorussus aquaticus]|uniref:Uncharacterized protein n=1 Tax=Halorussus aquaticus TaxID=2953748 RepID=A0ABD5Q5S5_9EURY|nr:hypothetical protein [Halorussus aquaticus]